MLFALLKILKPVCYCCSVLKIKHHLQNEDDNYSTPPPPPNKKKERKKKRKEVFVKDGNHMGWGDRGCLINPPPSIPNHRSCCEGGGGGFFPPPFPTSHRDSKIAETNV